VDYEQLILVFTSIIYEALPFVVLGVVLAGILEEFVPQQALIKVIPSNQTLAVALGAVLGLVFPMCECGIVVVMRRLLRKGLPLGVCVSYMLAGPIINVVVMLSTYAAFNTPDRAMSIFGGPLNVVALRVGLAFIVAVNTGLIVGRLQRKVGIANLLAPIVMRGLDEKLQKNRRGFGAEDMVAEAQQYFDHCAKRFHRHHGVSDLGRLPRRGRPAGPPAKQLAKCHSGRTRGRDPDDDGHRGPLLPVQ